MKTGFISREGDKFPVDLDRYGFFCREYVEKLIASNENEKKKFEEYRKSHTRFSPYFDYLIHQLGFSVKGIPINSDTMASSDGKGNLAVDFFNNEDQYRLIFVGVSDNQLEIDKGAILTRRGFILPDLCYLRLPSGELHETYAMMIVNQLAINNISVYQKLVRARDTKNNFLYSTFLINDLGFLKIGNDSEDRHVSYNSAVFSQYPHLEDIVNYYKKIGFNCNDIDYIRGDGRAIR